MAETAAPTFAELAALAAGLANDGKPSAAAVPQLDEQMLAPAVAPSLDDVAQEAVRKAQLAGTDTGTGAPVGVRALVGAAPEADRLATLQRSFPDATPLAGGGGNFVYTDPATGRRQTYAPIGWRIPNLGDVASVGGEALEGVGGTLGAVLGSGSGPLGTAAGGGLGAAAGKEGWQALMRLLGAQDTRTPVQRATDLATTAGLNAVMPEVGARLGGPLITSLLRSGPGTDTQIAARALDQAGLTTDLEKGLPTGLASESSRVQKIEQPLMQLPFSGTVRDRYLATKDQLEAGVQAAAERAAGGQPVPVPNTFATNVGTIAKTIEDTYRTARQQADDTAMNLIGADRPVDLQPLRDLRDRLEQQLAAAPTAQAERYKPALDRVNGILADATKTGSDTLPFGVVRNIRTDTGKAIDFTATGADSPVGLPPLRDLYGSLKESLLGAARDAGPDAEKALAAHDSMVSAYNAENGPAQTFADLMDPARRSDRLTTMMQSPKPIDQQGLAHLIHYATPEQRQELAAGTIQQMGTTRDNTFDVATWLRNYKATSQTARDLMFGHASDAGSLQTALNNLETVQRTASASANFTNSPKTAPSFAVIAALGMLGDVAGHLAAGELGSALGATGTVVAPSVTGRLLSSPPFVKWLTGTFAVNGERAGQWAAHLARLGTVAEADPKVAGLVAQLRQQLPDQLPAQPR